LEESEEQMATSPQENTSAESPHEDHGYDPEDALLVAHQAEHEIEVGEIDDESDVGYESDLDYGASNSVSPSVRDYAFENGRRYHKFREGHYQFPNDEPEQTREDMKHAMIVNLCGGNLHFSPLDNPQRVLDLGTGTGIWCINSSVSPCSFSKRTVIANTLEVGDQYPSASILGIDLSPIQPVWVPPNVKFMVDDFEDTVRFCLLPCFACFHIGLPIW
jgi:hypothetical protein